MTGTVSARAVVATGPESCGTKLLSRILATGFPHVEHRSMPHADVWWDPFLETRSMVAIVRDRGSAALSAVHAGHARDLDDASARYDRALACLGADVSGRTVAAWVRYERLVTDPVGEVGRLSRTLGVELGIPEPIYDGNTRWKYSDG